MQLKCKKRFVCVYTGGAVIHQMCQNWFVKFRAGDFLLNDAPQSNKPVEVDSDQTETLRKINIIPHGRQLTFSKYTNQ